MTLRNANSNRSTNDAATLSSAIVTNATTSAVVTVANADRTFFQFNNNDANQGVWLKLQAASVDNDKKGIFVAKDSMWEMPTQAIYTGEISAIADVDAPSVFYTEY